MTLNHADEGGLSIRNFGISKISLMAKNVVSKLRNHNVWWVSIMDLNLIFVMVPVLLNALGCTEVCFALQRLLDPSFGLTS